MALIKLGPEIISLRGRCGGIYYKKDKSGQHIQKMPRYWNYTRTPAQVGGWGWGSPFAASGISGFSGASLFWLAALVASYAIIWALFALAYLFYTLKGERKRITGYNWYLHFALGYPRAKRPPLWKPPKTPTEFPDRIAVYEESWSYERREIDFPDESPTAYYDFGGFFNGQNYYLAKEEGWELWWKDPVWVLSPGRGQEPAGKTYYSEGAESVGIYINPVTGSNTHVSLGAPPP